MTGLFLKKPKTAEPGSLFNLEKNSYTDCKLHVSFRRCLTFAFLPGIPLRRYYIYSFSINILSLWDNAFSILKSKKLQILALCDQIIFR
jgi:hypothetical protein